MRRLKSPGLFLTLAAIGAASLSLVFRSTAIGEILQEASEESLVLILGLAIISLLLSRRLKSFARKSCLAITALLIGALVYQSFRILPYRLHRANSISNPQGTPIRVGSFNVLMTSKPSSEALNWLNNLDLAILVEFNQEWDLATQAFHGIRRPSQMYFGIAILSKTPCLEQEENGVAVDSILDNNLASWQRCLLDIHGFRFNVYAVHPSAPMHIQNLPIRRSYMQSLSERLRRDPLPKIVVGDFNSSPWTDNLLEFASQHQLQSAYAVFPAYSTYPVQRYLPFIFGLPIDNILFSAVFHLNSMHRSPSFGSDHYPIEALLSVGADFSQIRLENGNQQKK